MDEITKDMLEKFKDDDDLTKAIRAFDTQMKAILKSWYANMRFMTSTNLHTDAAIKTFKSEVAETKDAIFDLVVRNPPLTGDDNPLKLMTTLKSHMMFAKDPNSLSHVTKDADDFHITGAFDEQSGERTHADVNQLNGRYCNVRGVRKKVLIIQEFLFIRSEMVRGRIVRMLEKTSRTNTSTANRSAPQLIDDNDRARLTNEIEDDDGSLPSTELTEEEKKMNDADYLCGPINEQHKDYESLSDADKVLLCGMVDTKIIACPKCLDSKRFIGQGAFKIHCAEVHNPSISADLVGDGTVR